MSRGVHGSGFGAGHEEREPEVVAVRVEPGVHALGVRVQDGSDGRARGGKIALGGPTPAEGPDEPVGVDGALAEQLRDAPGGDVAPDLHLPHPLLGVDVALGEEQVVRIRRR